MDILIVIAGIFLKLLQGSYFQESNTFAKNYNSLANRNHLITIDGKVIQYKADQKNLELKEDSTGYVEGYIDKEINKPISLDSSEYEYVLDEIIICITNGSR